MIKKYILTSLLAASTAAAFSFGSAANVYADNDRHDNDDVREEHNSKNSIRTTFFRVEREDDNDRQVVQVVPSNSNNSNNGNHVSVPEPATMLLIGSAIGGLALLRSRKD